MLNEGSGTSPSGAKPTSMRRSWTEFGRANPQIVEVAVRVLALAVLLALVTVGAALESRGGV